MSPSIPHFFRQRVVVVVVQYVSNSSEYVFTSLLSASLLSTLDECFFCVYVYVSIE
jgi:hypothetical protein